MKSDGRPDLFSKEDDKMNALLCGAGHDMRKLPVCPRPPKIDFFRDDY